VQPVAATEISGDHCGRHAGLRVVGLTGPANWAQRLRHSAGSGDLALRKGGEFALLHLRPGTGTHRPFRLSERFDDEGAVDAAKIIGRAGFW
jgi:hypothetical protein